MVNTRVGQCSICMHGINRLRELEDFQPLFTDQFSLVFVDRNAVNRNWLRIYRLPKSRIDDTILSVAYLLLEEDPGHYASYSEMFRTYNSRGEHRRALSALKEYLARTPIPDLRGEAPYEKHSDTIERAERAKSKESPSRVR